MLVDLALLVMAVFVAAPMWLVWGAVYLGALAGAVYVLCSFLQGLFEASEEDRSGIMDER
jgi:hypothetical protein